MSEPRRIVVFTTGRQDYGILRSSLMLLRDDRRFALQVWAGGMHLSPTFGRTIDLVRADGLMVSQEIAFLEEGRSDPARESARALEATAAALSRNRPDALLLLGDRSETLAAAMAATMENVAIAHLHGGEESSGAIDNAFRHALTKLSHLHLVSHEEHAQRVRQMGEEPTTVVVVGAGGLDNHYRGDLPDAAELAASFQLAMTDPIVLVTMHPATLGPSNTLAEVEAVAAAMESIGATYIITQANSDAGGDSMRAFWKKWASGRKSVAVVDALGERRFWGVLRLASAVLGNSSSGIIEAPSAGIPVVNVGDRQAGRLRSAHVTDVPAQAPAIARALAVALEAKTRERLRGVVGPYASGPAAPRIIEALASWNIPRPPRKFFYQEER